MGEILACRVCLASDDVKLCPLSKYKLVEAYESVTGIQLSADGLPPYICVYCSALLRKLLSFKETCLRSQELLKYFCSDLADGKLNITELKKLSPSTVQFTTTLTDYIIDIEYTEPVIKKEEEEVIKEEFEPKRKKKRKSSKVKELPFLKLEDDDFHDDFEEKNECNDLNVEVVILTKEQQVAEIEARKVSVNYVNSLYKCEKCYKGFITEGTYRNHMTRHDTSRGKYVCEVCYCVWGRSKSLRTHVVTAHERKFICKLCNFVSRSTNRAREHSQWHNGRTFDCKICGQSFSKSTSYLTHVRLQHPTNNSCDICGESFLGENGLNLHKRRAHIAEVMNFNVSCGRCGVEFESREVAKRHREHFVDGRCDDFCSCAKCGAYFKTVELLDKHMKEHPGDSTCLECNKKFANAHSCSIHVQRVHLGIKMKQTPKRVTKERRVCSTRPCVCEICGKSCTSNTSLVAHQRIHSGEKPFQCTECPKKFSVYQRLQIHIRTHTGECPYQCSQCPKAFKHKAALNRHFRVHSGDKPYTCSHCGKAFSQSNSMKIHVNTVHLKMPTPYRRKNKNTHTFLL